MPMNARLLRPKASSGFRPDSISGLANWWDASDASTLTLNAGAVQTWASKAGSRSAATQSTAGSRPVTTTANGKTALLFDGADDGLDFTGTARTDETWIIAAAQTADQGGTRQLISDNGNGYGIGIAKGGTRLVDTIWGAYTDGVNRHRHTYSGNPSTPFGPGVVSVTRSAAGGGLMFVDGTQRLSIFGAASFTTSLSTTISRIGYISSTVFQFQGWIGEVLCYGRALTSAERNAVELYLGRKWGIAVTQVPSVSNADAQDWVNRVYANGGTVSASTASAVNSFCDAIDAASIRDRFFRLNLFCGTGLNAALVPLYRGPSRTGAQYGNQTDTNNGPFVSGDYAETGATGGLTANGTSKYLNTGLKADVLSQADRHLSVVMDSGSVGVTGRQIIGVDNFGGAGNAFWGLLVGTAAFSSFLVRSQATAVNSSNVNVTGDAHILVSGNGSAAGYANGVSAVTGPAGAFTAPAIDVYVLGLNRNGAVGDYFNGRLNAYSIGAAMTAQQVANFYTAMNTFETSMSRA